MKLNLIGYCDSLSINIEFLQDSQMFFHPFRHVGMCTADAFIGLIK